MSNKNPKIHGVFRKSFIFLSLTLFFFSVWATEYQIRAPKEASCAFYLVPKENTTFGTKITDTLDIEELRAWLETNPDIREDLDIYAVGASFERAEHDALMASLNQLVEEYKKENPSLKNVQTNSMRRLKDFLIDQRGVYAVNPDGSMEKLSNYNPNDARVDEALKAKLDNESRPLYVVGVPLIGRTSQEFKTELQKLSDTEIKVKSNFVAAAEKSVKEPSKAIRYIIERLRYFFPIREDLQKPTYGEVDAARKKLVVPGILTFVVQAFTGMPLSIAIPVTIVNALNSGLTGTYRTFLGNWFRRSATFFPSTWLKQVSLSTIFTADLYWAGAGAAIGNILSFAGWVNMFMQKWPTIIFNSLWRTPYSDLVYKWEAWRNKKYPTEEANQETRLAAGSLEKFMSYIMTQFFIVSIVSKDSLVDLVRSADGIYFKAGELLANENLIMGFNAGHFVMAGVGLTSLILAMKPELLNPAAKLALKLDKFEGKTYAAVGNGLSWLAKKCITPFVKLFGKKEVPPE